MKFIRKRKEKLLVALLTSITLVNAKMTSFASGIGTAEVQTATDNIKRVITSIAMPLRWCINICKHCCCSN